MLSTGNGSRGRPAMSIPVEVVVLNLPKVTACLSGPLPITAAVRVTGEAARSSLT